MKLLPETDPVKFLLTPGKVKMAESDTFTETRIGKNFHLYQ